jgi:hypothetical protein
MKNTEIKKIALKFNKRNSTAGVPELKYFIEAFKKYSGTEKFDIELLDEAVLFTSNDVVYFMDTYEGRSARLKGYYERDSYDEIYTQTELSHWSDVYTDAGIEKHVFIPELLSRWESFWASNERQFGDLPHIAKLKEASWRRLQVFMNLYDTSGDVITLAHDLEESELYPLAVLTMLDIFDADTCFTEYCEYELDSRGDYESIEVETDGEGESMIFYIKEYEWV